MAISGITAVNLVYKESYPHGAGADFLIGQGFMQFVEFVDVYNNNARVFSEGFNELIFGAGFNKEAGIDIHVVHRFVQLCP